MKITLIGSMKFITAFNDWNIILSKGGHLVYSIPPLINAGEEAKRRFDLIHQCKIDESDAILVLNVNGYVGKSTADEIEWARMKRKDIYWLENRVNGKILGVSVWSLQNLFEDSSIGTVPESKEYGTEINA